MKIHELMDTTLLDQHLQDNNVSMVEDKIHGTDNAILNYTRNAMFRQLWDEVTTNCRGLVYDRKTGDIVARPWSKFYNHNEVSAPDLNTFGEVEVTDKMDGSLGIGYRSAEGKLLITTKGSLQSEIGMYAQNLLDKHTENINYGITPLFEIISPINRIVLDYKGVEDVFLLGGVVMDTGEVLGPNDERLSSFSGPRTQVFTANTVSEALSMKPRKDAEGVIIRDKATGRMVKIKQQDYLELHRVLTNVTDVTVWKAMRDNNMDKLLDSAPDETYDAIRAVMKSLTDKYDLLLAEVAANAQKVLNSTNMDVTTPEGKKQLAANAFALLDNKKDANRVLIYINSGEDRLQRSLWSEIRPDGRHAKSLGYF